MRRVRRSSVIIFESASGSSLLCDEHVRIVLACGTTTYAKVVSIEAAGRRSVSVLTRLNHSYEKKLAATKYAGPQTDKEVERYGIWYVGMLVGDSGISWRSTNSTRRLPRNVGDRNEESIVNQS